MLVSGQRRVSGTGKRSVAWLRMFDGLCRDRQDALRVDLVALHSPLATIHYSPGCAALPYDGTAHTGRNRGIPGKAGTT